MPWTRENIIVSLLENGEDHRNNSYGAIESYDDLLSRRRSTNTTMPRGHDQPVQQLEIQTAIWPQYFASFTAILGGMVVGTAIGWTGPIPDILRSKCNTSRFSRDRRS